MNSVSDYPMVSILINIGAALFFQFTGIIADSACIVWNTHRYTFDPNSILMKMTLIPTAIACFETYNGSKTFPPEIPAGNDLI